MQAVGELTSKQLQQLKMAGVDMDAAFASLGMNGKQAMEAIEAENPRLEGVLPKEVYAQLVPEEEPELLSNIVRIFKDIPENCTVDIFGEIYEYFLGNFALAEGKDGGTFYTPATVVRYMVEVLNPQPGDKKFLDAKLPDSIQTHEGVTSQKAA